MSFCIWILWFASAWSLEEDDLPRAKQAYQYGKQMYDEAKYEEAIQAFQRAFEISQNHQLLFNLAMAYRMNDDLETARSYFEQYQRLCNDQEWSQAQRDSERERAESQRRLRHQIQVSDEAAMHTPMEQ